MAAKSGVSIATIKRLEAQDGPIGGRLDTVGKIVSALEPSASRLTHILRR
jgi:predicted transcriptional regulator